MLKLKCLLLMCFQTSIVKVKNTAVIRKGIRRIYCSEKVRQRFERVEKNISLERTNCVIKSLSSTR